MDSRKQLHEAMGGGGGGGGGGEGAELEITPWGGQLYVQANLTFGLTFCPRIHHVKMYLCHQIRSFCGQCTL